MASKMEVLTSVIPHFELILTGQSIYGIIFMNQCHFQGQNVQSKVKNKNKMCFNKYK